ncbi:hypothetical protein BRC21_01925 [Candidatus Saccharibacteria bacterium SW_7_54_9]|nr:MAG: hypothetical protein BRC21_01925 [Candidatus Saccharibacteria bacterium SW_7_54_9]
MGWALTPESIYEATQLFKYHGIPIYIDEHGLADGKDRYRGEFIQESLRALHRSIHDGAEVRGYFHWSLLDNFEWSEGFWPKFGLVEVDNETKERYVRSSARVYGRIAQTNGLQESRRSA